MVEVLLYVHRNRSCIRDGSPGRPPRLSTAPELSVNSPKGNNFKLSDEIDHQSVRLCASRLANHACHSELDDTLIGVLLAPPTAQTDL